jgi:hypothetical protein
MKPLQMPSEADREYRPEKIVQARERRRRTLAPVFRMGLMAKVLHDLIWIEWQIDLSTLDHYFFGGIEERAARFELSRTARAAPIADGSTKPKIAMRSRACVAST